MGRENFLPRAVSRRRVEMWICKEPSSLSVTATFLSVLLPHFGQNTLDTLLVVRKQA